MTPATIIREAQADGVSLALSPSGTIKATGDGAAVSRWVTVIRDFKAEIVTVLKGESQSSRNDPEQAGPDLPLLAAVNEYRTLIDRLMCTEEERQGYHRTANCMSPEALLADLPKLRSLVDRDSRLTTRTQTLAGTNSERR